MNEGGGGPGLVGFSHGPACFSMIPFVEFPLTGNSFLIKLREFVQFIEGKIFGAPVLCMNLTQSPPTKGQIPPLW